MQYGLLTATVNQAYEVTHSAPSAVQKITVWIYAAIALALSVPGVIATVLAAKAASL